MTGLDLDAIRNSRDPWADGRFWRDRCFALCDEVERLRAENEELRAERRADWRHVPRTTEDLRNDLA